MTRRPFTLGAATVLLVGALLAFAPPARGDVYNLKVVTDASPLSITKNPAPVLPSPATVLPASNVRSLNERVSRSRSFSSKSAKSGTLRSSSGEGSATRGF